MSIAYVASTSHLVESYLSAKNAIIEKGYAEEIDWQDSLSFDEISCADFMKEAAWVVLSSGMRESVIRKIFPHISEVFLHWECPYRITSQADSCKAEALKVFGHEGKISAILEIIRRICIDGFTRTRKLIQNGGIDFLMTMPFLGPATARHLAKNLGIEIAKPDRHLIRAAAASGHESPATLCETISGVVGDRISVVDIVIWRFATLFPNYERHFACT